MYEHCSPTYAFSHSKWHTRICHTHILTHMYTYTHSYTHIHRYAHLYTLPQQPSIHTHTPAHRQIHLTYTFTHTHMQIPHIDTHVDLQAYTPHLHFFQTWSMCTCTTNEIVRIQNISLASASFSKSKF